MSLQRFPPTNRKAEADQSSLRKDGTSTTTYKSNVTTATYNLPGRDSVRQAGSDALGVAESSQVATPNYSKYLSVSLSHTHLCKFC